MSYDTLPELSGSKAQALTSYPEPGQGTEGSKVAEAFAEHVKGKIGISSSLIKADIHLL